MLRAPRADALSSLVTVLGVIVVIRILLSFSFEVEIDGSWPWNRWRDTRGAESGTSRI